MTTATEQRPMIRETENGTEKWCAGCRDYHPANEEFFSRDAKSATNLSSWCRKSQKERYEKSLPPMAGEDLNRTDFWKDALGRFVHVENIKEIDKSRDELVRRLLGKALALQKAMLEFKELAFDEVDAFVDLSANEYDVSLGGKKGNLSLTTYDGKYKVEVQNQELQGCDERILVAKKLVDQCLSKWSEDSRPEIRTIVNDAFQVNQAGKINIRKIQDLRRHKITDPDWQKAMNVISDSLTITGSKSYLRIYERVGRDCGWRNIPLNFAAL